MKTPDIITTLDAAISAIVERMQAKGPIYTPDAEWTRLQACADALRQARLELIRTMPEKPDIIYPETCGR